MKKYNTGVPIDIKKLKEDERKTAFHEWAEGSEALETLLTEGYKKGFLSHACCSGDTGRPYIDYELNDDNSRKIAIWIAEQLVASDLNCQVTIHDNFLLNESDPKTFPTRDIISLNVQTLIENREEVFNKMVSAIRELEIEKINLPRTVANIPSKKFNKECFRTENNFLEQLGAHNYTDNEISSQDTKKIEQYKEEKNSPKNDDIQI